MVQRMRRREVRGLMTRRMKGRWSVVQSFKERGNWGRRWSSDSGDRETEQETGVIQRMRRLVQEGVQRMNEVTGEGGVH